ncbi:MAG: hypothetical protein GXY86_09495 [Firmicutes bacterium]|nr:hypothetical protein [Bacillota bacterium]
MPYCQECGSRFEDESGVCKSCGVELTVNGAGESGTSLPDEEPEKPELSAETMKPNNNPVFEKIMDDFMHQEGLSLGSRRNQVESHLGRGLIKPVTIENCMDGYHFKYDEPPRQINKPEPQNENVVEFRVSGEPEAGIANQETEEVRKETGEADAKIIEEETVSLETDLGNGEQTVSELGSEVELEENGSEVVSGSENLGANQSDLLQDEAENLTENNTDSEVVEEETELSVDTSPEVIWEGYRTWYGLTLNEFYRLTNCSAVALKEDGSKFTEVDWGLVSTIHIKQNWLAKLLNVGNLELIGLNSGPLLILEGINNPEKIRKRLVKILDYKV